MVGKTCDPRARSGVTCMPWWQRVCQGLQGWPAQDGLPRDHLVLRISAGMYMIFDREVNMTGTLEESNRCYPANEGLALTHSNLNSQISCECEGD